MVRILSPALSRLFRSVKSGKFSWHAKRRLTALIWAALLHSGSPVNADPYTTDTDGDGYSDGEELAGGYDPNNSAVYPGYETSIDSDGDGYSDYDENSYGSNPSDSSSYPGSAPDPAYQDSDGDGYSDSYETNSGTDPFSSTSYPGAYVDPYSIDSDGDGFSDGTESSNGTNPYDSSSYPTYGSGYSPDSDGDGFTDADEFNNGTDPNSAASFPGSTYFSDYDGDGWSDGDEINYGTDPNNSASYPGAPDPYTTDSDGDGYSDYAESSQGTDPHSSSSYPGYLNSIDSDGDGHNDADEIAMGYNPNDSSSFPGMQNTATDWDGDGYSDYDENMAGTNPYDSSSYPGSYNPTSDPGNSYDSDGDSYSDSDEYSAGTNPYDSTSYPGSQPGIIDSDGDGYSDGDEYAVGTNPFDSTSYPGSQPGSIDSDGDGLYDSEELSQGTNPNNSDTDGDGLSDFVEVRGIEITLWIDDASTSYGYSHTYTTNPTNPDTDGDLLPDGWEAQYGTDPTYAGDGLYDGDNDGLSRGQEVAIYLTNPFKRDSDDDGESDGYEVSHGTNPLDQASRTSVDSDGDVMSDDWETQFALDKDSATDASGDADNDGLINFREYLTGADPTNPDSDNDGYKDGLEWANGFNPTNPSDVQTDRDHDALPDLWELLHGLDPFNPEDSQSDNDGDWLAAELEYNGNLNPTLADTDGDGISDYDEYFGIIPPPYDSDGDLISDEDESSIYGTDPNHIDTDRDGISDYGEIFGTSIQVDFGDQNIGISFITNPRLPDTDDDGMDDLYEILHLFDPTNPADGLQDEDGDTLANGEEISIYGTDPFKADTDLDGESDSIELSQGTDPRDSKSNHRDSDEDLMRDSWERANGLDPDDPADATGNPDQDGLVNIEEFQNNTNPHARDSDGDGYEDKFELDHGFSPTDSTDAAQDFDEDEMPDLWELTYHFDPLNSADGELDFDGDGVSNEVEFLLGTRPNSPDTDNDGLFDSIEAFTLRVAPAGQNPSTYFTDPLDPDSDGDLLPDRFEILNNLHALNPADGTADQDGDGLSNGIEIALHRTDWKERDTDSDGESDGEEIAMGTNPLDILSRTSLDGDGDHMSDEWEGAKGLNHQVANGGEDPDNDNLNNHGEYLAGTDPKVCDTDNDTYLDGFERSHGKDPLDPDDAQDDTDGDRLPDLWEMLHNLPWRNPIHESNDPDNDEVENLTEFLNGSNPNLSDSDGDGIEDDSEIAEQGITSRGIVWAYDIHPGKSDTDGDEQNDLYEIERGTDPTDRLSKVVTGTDQIIPGGNILTPVDGSPAPTSPFWTFGVVDDSDGDGISDTQEEVDGTDPDDASDFKSHLSLSIDADQDGLPDLWELANGLDPSDVTQGWRDADYDRINNFREYVLNSSPVGSWSPIELTGMTPVGPQVGQDPRFPSSTLATFNDFNEMARITIDSGQLSVSIFNGVSWSAPVPVLLPFSPESVGEVVLNNLGTLAIEARVSVNGVEQVVIVVRKKDGDVDTVGEGMGWLDLKDLRISDSGFVVAGVVGGLPNAEESIIRWRNGLVDVFHHPGRVQIAGVTEQGGILDRVLGLFRAGQWRPQFAGAYAVGPYGEIKESPEYPIPGALYPYGPFLSMSLYGEVIAGVSRIDPAEVVRGYHARFLGAGGEFMITDDNWIEILNDPFINDAGIPEGGVWNSLGGGRYTYGFEQPGSPVHEFDFDYDNDGFWDDLEIFASKDPQDNSSFPGEGSNVVISDANRSGDFVGWVFHGATVQDPDSGIEIPENDAFLWQYRDFSYFGGADHIWVINNTGSFISSDLEVVEAEDFSSTGNYVSVHRYRLFRPENDANDNGMADNWETYHAVRAASADLDGDGLTAREEFVFGTSPNHTDTDGDSLRDAWEIKHGFNPLKRESELSLDFDGDTLGIAAEAAAGTDPYRADTDDDRIRDDWEVRHGRNPLSDQDAIIPTDDEDRDGFTNLAEWEAGTNPFDYSSNPNSVDTDKDGAADSWEIAHQFDPSDPSDGNLDLDFDGLTNAQESRIDGDPRLSWKWFPIEVSISAESDVSHYGSTPPFVGSLNDLGQLGIPIASGNNWSVRIWDRGNWGPQLSFGSAPGFDKAEAVRMNNFGLIALQLRNSVTQRVKIGIRTPDGIVQWLGEDRPWSAITDLAVTDSGYIGGTLYLAMDPVVVRKLVWRRGEVSEVALPAGEAPRRGLAERGEMLATNSVLRNGNWEYQVAGFPLAVSPYGELLHSPRSTDLWTAQYQQRLGKAIFRATSGNWVVSDRYPLNGPWTGTLEVPANLSPDFSGIIPIGNESFAFATYALDMNDHGDYVGWVVSENPTAYTEMPFFWSGGRISSPHSGGAFGSGRAYQINARRQILMRSAAPEQFEEESQTLAANSSPSWGLLVPDNDQDKDGLADDWKHFHAPGNAGADFDGDGLSNRLEFALGLNPRRKNTDGDPAADGWEVSSGWNPLVDDLIDSDHDGLADVWETDFGLDPTSGADALLDMDGDGLSNKAENDLGTDPGTKDTDGDGVEDLQEIICGTSPRDPHSFEEADYVLSVNQGESATITRVLVNPLSEGCGWQTVILPDEIGGDPVPASWIEAEDAMGILQPQETRTISYHIDTGNLEGGLHYARIQRQVGDFAPVVTRVRLHVKTPPGVEVVAPVMGADFANGSQIRLIATPNSGATGVESIQFFVNGEAVGAPDSSSPYELPYEIVSPPGSLLQISAQAKTADEIEGPVSPPVSISVTAYDVDEVVESRIPFEVPGKLVQWNSISLGANLSSNFAESSQESKIWVGSQGWGMKSGWDGASYFFSSGNTAEPLAISGKSPLHVSGNQSSSTAGFMIRESLRADGRFVAIAITPLHEVRVLCRRIAGQAVEEMTVGGAAGYGEFYRIVRMGDVIFCHRGTDTEGWEVIGRFDLAGFESVYAGGFATAGMDRRVRGCVEFRNVNLSRGLASVIERCPDLVAIHPTNKDESGAIILGDSGPQNPAIRSVELFVAAVESENLPLQLTIRSLGADLNPQIASHTIEEHVGVGNFVRLGTYNFEEGGPVIEPMGPGADLKVVGLMRRNLTPGTGNEPNLHSLDRIEFYSTGDLGDVPALFASGDTDGDGHSNVSEIEGEIPSLILDTIGANLGGLSGGQISGVPTLVSTSPFDYDTDRDFVSDLDDFSPTSSADGNVDGDGDLLRVGIERIYGTSDSKWDHDSDTFSDYEEVVVYGTDPTDGTDIPDRSSDLDDVSVPQVGSSGDIDGDGLLDAWEIDAFGGLQFGRDDDSDGDGVKNRDELVHGTNPAKRDSDGDGWEDWLELLSNSNPIDRDSTVADVDLDGLGDAWEIQCFGSITAQDGAGDPDSDLVSNTDEQMGRCNPLSDDTDLDLWPDGFEIANGFDPLDPSDGRSDIDRDGLSKGRERLLGTSDENPDTDGDKSSDGYEFSMGTDPTDPNSFPPPPLNPYLIPDEDGDGLSDLWESDHGLDSADETDALLDPDNDGLPNLREYIIGTDPRKSDTDSDGYSDRFAASKGWPVSHAHLAPGGNEDLDGDGLPDWWESRFGFPPYLEIVSESGPDGQPVDTYVYRHIALDYVHYDSEEDRLNGIPSSSFSPDDFDGDGVSNHLEFTYRTDPANPDSDGDGVDDYSEIIGVYNDEYELITSDPMGFAAVPMPTVLHSDTDGIPDLWEMALGLDPSDPLDGAVDGEPDSLDNYWEYRYRTKREVADTDLDGVSDGLEVVRGTNPRVAQAVQDLDQDGMPDWWEIANALNPDFAGDRDADPDRDGLSNLREFKLGLDPNDHDFDDDGLSDGHEVDLFRTDPRKSDSDNDGISDGDEAHVYSTDPSRPNQISNNQPLPDSYTGAFGNGILPTRSLVADDVLVREQPPAGGEPEPEPECGGIGLGWGMRWDSGLGCIPNCPPGYFYSVEQGDCLPIPPWEDDEDPDPAFYPKITGSDITGNEHRRLGLDGRLLDAASPDESEESDRLREETSIDAFDLELSHSTSDVYIELGGSDLKLEVSRIYSRHKSDTTPGKSLQRPFGIGWTTNLSSYIRVDEHFAEGVVQSSQATVVDENGGSHQFVRINGDWIYQPSTGASTNSLANTLSINGNAGSGTFRKKFGTTVNFSLIGYKKAYHSISQKTGPNRYVSTIASVDDNYTQTSYFRATSVCDSKNNRLEFQYPGNATLVPSTVTDPLRGLRISISQDEDGRILAVSDPNGNVTRYGYDSKGILNSVRRGDGSTVSYEFSDSRLSKITDPFGNSYRFEYGGGSQTIEYWNPLISAYSNAAGTETLAAVKRVSGPSGTAHFAREGKIRFGIITEGKVPIREAGSRTLVRDASGRSIEFEFVDPKGFDLGESPGNIQYYSGGVLESREIAVGFRSMLLRRGSLEELYEFDPAAGFAVRKATDASGTTTHYVYNDPAPGQHLSGLRSQGLMRFLPDPSQKTDATGVTFYTYNSHRVVTEIKSNRVTSYLRDGSGNVWLHQIVENGDTVFRKEFEWAGNGFLVEERLIDLEGDEDLVTRYTPDARFRTHRKIVDPEGLNLSSETIYDHNGNVVRQIDERGFVTTFEYDAFNRVKSIVPPPFADPSVVGQQGEPPTHTSKVLTTRSESSFGGEKVSVTTYEDGVIVSREITERDSARRVVRKGTDFDLNGDLQRGASGDIVTDFEYDGIGLLQKTVNPRGFITKFSYDFVGRKTEEVHAWGTEDAVSTRYHYSRVGEQWAALNVTSPAVCGGIMTGFKPITVVGEQSVVYNVYDRAYRTIASHVDYGEGIASTHTEYDPFGNAERVTDPSGLVTEHDYIADRVKETRVGMNVATGPLTTKTRWSSTGLALESTDVFGKVTTTKYDRAGRPYKVITPVLEDETGIPILDALGNEQQAETITGYDDAGNVVSVMDPRGHTTLTQYDSRNRAIIVTTPSVPVDGAAVSVPLHTLSFYNGRDQVVKTVAPDFGVTETFYDAAGRAWRTLAPAVDVVTGFDSSGDPVVVSESTETVTRYDANGNAVEVDNAKGVTVINTYDALDRLRTTLDGEEILTEFDYDSLGNRTLVRDGLNQVTRFTYDGLGRNTSIDYPVGVQDVFLNYDASALRSRSDGNGLVEYDYDDFNRLETVTYPGVGTRGYTYDKAGRILTVSESADSRANVAYTYDSWGRQRSETSQGVTHQYSYDLGGNRTQVVYGLTAQTIVSTYDALNRLETLVEGGRTTRYRYDRGARITRKELPNGQVARSVFDRQGRRTADFVHGLGSGGADGPLLQRRDYFHDAVGNLVLEKELSEDFETPGSFVSRIVRNTYDDNDRLDVETIVDAGVVTISDYDHDDANNRTRLRIDKGGDGIWDETSAYDYVGGWNQLQTFETTDAAGRLLAEVAFDYDANGNRRHREAALTTYQPDGTPGTTSTETTEYGWDKENRLVSVVRSRGSAVDTYGYAYDYRTRRILRDESGGIGNDGEPGETTALVFGGGTSAQEWEAGQLQMAKAAGAISATARPDVAYMRGSDWGGGVGGVLYTLRAVEGSADYGAGFNFYNGRGDVVAKTDEEGDLIWQGAYEAFGKRTREEGENADRQRGNTKDEDPTGLLNEGFRYRDLETGTWLSRDPAGFVDGPNLYAYVRQNPWTKFDPLGLREQTENEKESFKSQRTRIAHARDQEKKYRDGASARGVSAENKKKMLESADNWKWYGDRTEAAMNTMSDVISRMADDSPDISDIVAGHSVDWTLMAAGEMGVSESTDGWNKSIRAYMNSTDASEWFDDDGTARNAWCACFVNWSLEAVGPNARGSSAAQGLPGYDGIRAKSWGGWGEDAGGPFMGSVGVMKTSEGHHVGIVMGTSGEDGSDVVLLGGNQGDSVNLSVYSRSKFTAFRYPTGFSGKKYETKFNNTSGLSGGSTR